jgi:hypothetical protein
VHLFAFPFPAIVIAEMLGIRSEDRDQFGHWSDDIVNGLGGGDLTLVEAANAGIYGLVDVLVAERVGLLLQSTDSSALTKAKETLREFSEFARNKLSKDTLIADGPDVGKNYAASIRLLVAKELRPLSHRIWTQENRKYSNFSLAEISRRALSKFSTGSALVAVVYCITSIPNIARYLGFEQALFRSIVAGVVVFSILRLAALIKPTTYLFAFIWFLLVTFLASSIAFYSGDFFFGQTEGYRILESILATWIWISQLAFVSSFLLDLRRGQKSLSSEVTASFGPDPIDKAARFSSARIQNRDFANFLHGQVQNKLYLYRVQWGYCVQRCFASY